ncbi:hypothetical protein [Microcystis sp.]|jgi:hypothetical protein
MNIQASLSAAKLVSINDKNFYQSTKPEKPITAPGRDGHFAARE